MAELPAPAPVCSTGRSSSRCALTLWLTSPLSVCSRAAASFTVTDSVALPTSSSNVDAQVGRYLDRQTLPDVFLESWHGDRDFVRSGRQFRKRIVAGRGALRRIERPCIGIAGLPPSHWTQPRRWGRQWCRLSCRDLLERRPAWQMRIDTLLLGYYSYRLSLWKNGLVPVYFRVSFRRCARRRCCFPGRCIP